MNWETSNALEESMKSEKNERRIKSHNNNSFISNNVQYNNKVNY